MITALHTPEAVFFRARPHDALLIDADSHCQSGTKSPSGQIALQAGLHPLQINYLAATDASLLSLLWQVPGEEMKPVPNSQFAVKSDAKK